MNTKISENMKHSHNSWKKNFDNTFEQTPPTWTNADPCTRARRVFARVGLLLPLPPPSLPLLASRPRSRGGDRAKPRREGGREGGSRKDIYAVSLADHHFIQPHARNWDTFLHSTSACFDLLMNVMMNWLLCQMRTLSAATNYTLFSLIFQAPVQYSSKLINVPIVLTYPT